MQLRNIAGVALLLAATGSAAPTPELDIVHGKVVGQWTFRDVQVRCRRETTDCRWSFAIDRDNGRQAISCTLVQPELHADTQQAKCMGSDYFASIGWSNAGFWTMAVVDPSRKLISYPAYNTKEIRLGGTAKPKKENVERIE